MVAGNKKGMKELNVRLNADLVELVAVVRGQLSKNDRKKMNAQIIIDVHQVAMSLRPT